MNLEVFCDYEINFFINEIQDIGSLYTVEGEQMWSFRMGSVMIVVCSHLQLHQGAPRQLLWPRRVGQIQLEPCQALRPNFN